MNATLETSQSGETVDMIAMRDLVESSWSLKAKIDKLESEAEKLRESRAEIEAQLLDMLETCALDSFASESCKISVSADRAPLVPRDESDKAALFSELQARGMFYEFATVNSQSLKSLVKNLRGDMTPVQFVERWGVAALRPEAREMLFTEQMSDSEMKCVAIAAVMLNDDLLDPDFAAPGVRFGREFKKLNWRKK